LLSVVLPAALLNIIYLYSQRNT